MFDEPGRSLSQYICVFYDTLRLSAIDFELPFNVLRGAAAKVTTVDLFGWLLMVAAARTTTPHMLARVVSIAEHIWKRCLRHRVALTHIIVGAVDVAFTEASVGAGVSTVFFVAAVYYTTRRTKD